jgi:hypothetical protein
VYHSLYVVVSGVMAIVLPCFSLGQVTKYDLLGLLGFSL